jgi:hypothetical protein
VIYSAEEARTTDKNNCHIVRYDDGTAFDLNEVNKEEDV